MSKSKSIFPGNSAKTPKNPERLRIDVSNLELLPPNPELLLPNPEVLAPKPSNLSLSSSSSHTNSHTLAPDIIKRISNERRWSSVSSDDKIIPTSPTSSNVSRRLSGISDIPSSPSFPLNIEQGPPTPQAQYDEVEYFKNGVYQNRYNDKTNLVDPKVLFNSCRRILLNKINKNPDQEDINFTIYDFGCGNGRFLLTIQRIAERLSSIIEKLNEAAKKEGKKDHKNLKIKFIGSDVSKDGIEIFSEKLKDAGYDEEKDPNLAHSPSSGGSINIQSFIKRFRKNLSLNITLMRNSVNIPTDELLRAVVNESFNDDNTVDLIMSMFGVLAYFSPYDRKELISNLGSIMHDGSEFIATVPTYNKFKKEQKDMLEGENIYRKEDFQKTGRIFYERDGRELNLYLSSSGFSKTLLEESGFELIGGKIRESHITDESVTTHDFTKALTDRIIIARLLPEEKREYFTNLYKEFEGKIKNLLPENSDFVELAQDIVTSKNGSRFITALEKIFRAKDQKEKEILTKITEYYDKYDQSVKELFGLHDILKGKDKLSEWEKVKSEWNETQSKLARENLFPQYDLIIAKKGKELTKDVPTLSLTTPEEPPTLHPAPIGAKKSFTSDERNH